MDKKGTDIYSGMTAKLYIVINFKKDVLLVPTQFIQKKWSNSLVDFWSWSIKQIVTGISTSTNTEVVSWLNEWDTIIRTVTITKDSISNGWLFSPPRTKTWSLDRNWGSWFNGWSRNNRAWWDFWWPPQWM
jgi:hypothetical protein